MIQFSKIKDVKFPSRGTKQSAGIDFYVPRFDTLFLRHFKSKNMVYIDQQKKLITLHPGDRTNIPSGIRCKIDKDYALIAFNKSGVSTKLGLDVLANVVDSDYQGEIHLSVVNTSKETVCIKEGDKLVQFILLKVGLDDIEEIDDNLIHQYVTDRGDKGFGSTNNR